MADDKPEPQKGGDTDRKYEHALSAALVILNEIDSVPDMGKHNRLALAVFSILHAMESYKAESRKQRVEFSVN
jgi:hypothetical protein